MPTPGENADLPHHCIKCDYDMQGLTTSVCPECGTVFEAAKAREAIERSWQLGRLVWILFLPPASLIVLLPILGWMFPNPDSGFRIVLGGALLAIIFGSAFFAVRAASILSRSQLRMRPGEDRTAGFYLHAAFITVVILVMQGVSGWFAFVIGFVIGLAVGSIHIAI